jgi:ribonuclease HI
MLFRCYSDAASFNNGHKDPSLPMYASCGLVITSDEKILLRASKFFDDKTISYGELKGVLLVLDLLKKRILDKYPELEKPYKIEIYSDSQFAIKGINEWMPNWIRKTRDWKKDVWYNASGNEVGQYKLFREIKLKYIDNPDYDIKFIHVKGHTNKKDFNSLMNDTCDKLAKAKLKEGRKK